MTKIEAEKIYKEYVDTHISNVKRAFKEYGIKLCERLSIDPSKLAWQIETHDQSKWSEEEFEGYRMKFHPSDEDDFTDEVKGLRFNKAWMHHLKNNPHHPEYWAFQDTQNDEIVPYEMPKYYVAEMLLDWQSMRYKFGGTLREYWEGKGHEKFMHPNTVALVDSIIDVFDKEEEEG